MDWQENTTLEGDSEHRVMLLSCNLVAMIKLYTEQPGQGIIVEKYTTSDSLPVQF